MQMEARCNPSSLPPAQPRHEETPAGEAGRCPPPVPYFSKPWLSSSRKDSVLEPLPPFLQHTKEKIYSKACAIRDSVVRALTGQWNHEELGVVQSHGRRNRKGPRRN